MSASTYTFWDLKGLSFKAKGTAGNTWNVVKVNPDKSLVIRALDGQQHWIDTQLLINLVNEKG
jgi:hypothetical protein